MDGAIVYSCSPVDEHVEWLRRRQLPLVLVDQPPDDRFPERQRRRPRGRRAAATHLVELGHRRIALLAAGRRRRRHPTTGTSRASACAAGATRWTRPGSRRCVRYVERSARRGGVRRGPRAARRTGPAHGGARLLRRPRRGRAARRRRPPACGSPRTLSVVGFDDSPLARRLTPALTTVRQDVVEKGTRPRRSWWRRARAPRRATRRRSAPPAGDRAGAAGQRRRRRPTPSADTNGTFVG